MLDYFALFLLVFVVLTLFYGIIAIHDIPYEIAKHRKHPHQDAIHVAGWVSLLTLHVLWPFLWIWAMLYREDRGWGFNTTGHAQASTVDDEIVKLRDLEHVTSIVVTHQIRDAHYIAAHEAIKKGDRVQIVPAPETTSEHATFMVLHEGRIQFTGSAAELLGSQDAYLKEFLFMTLPPW